MLRTRIPHRIETERLVLRCWQPADAPKLVEAISANLEHLRPWMPWAVREPESVAAKKQRIQSWRANFDLGRQFFYGIFSADESQILGGTGLHRDIGDGMAAIGYWIDKNFVNRGLITEAAGALAQVGFEFERLRRIEIHCDPANLASGAVARKLGFENVLTIANCVRSPSSSPSDVAIWATSAAGYPNSRAAQIVINSFDAAGARLLSDG